MELKAGSVIASRYRADTLSVDEADERVARGVEVQTGEAVVLHELTLDHQRPFEHLREVSHAHLARVLEIVTLDASVLVVSEFINGQAFEEHAADALRAHHVPVDAVRFVLRIVDVLSTLHSHGAAHGYLNPSSIIALPDDRPGPVLGFQGHRDSAYVSPERRAQGSAPSEADDSWAAAALLFYALTGTPPPSQGVSSEAELEAHGIRHPELLAALLDGLNTNPAARSGSVRLLKRQLARWFVGHAAEESIPPPHQASVPPPFPPQSNETVSAPPASPSVVADEERGARRRFIYALAVGGLALGVGVAWVSSGRKAPEPPPPAPIASAPPEEKASIDLSEVAVTSDKDALMGDKMATCVAGYLPSGTFGSSPKLDWMCTETHPSKGATQLRVALIQSAPKARVTESMKLFSRMGWYDLAAFAVLRAACCNDPPPFELPEPAKGCEPMGRVLEDLGRAVVTLRDHDALLDTYTSTIHCELNSGRGKSFGRTERPAGGQDTAFRDLIRPLQAQ